VFEFGAVSYDVSRWPTAGGAQVFPKADRNPFGVSKVCSKSVSATSSSWMQTLRACVKMSIISVKTVYLRATGKGSHKNLIHPKGVVLTISGKPGDDAKHYQEKEVAKKIKESQK
jgi:predicted RNA binding protein YcfA (HicA-like mRNA interferase family)